ncbi:MAG: hypothetical protein RLZZ517_156 [Candidatus Parcubacteria bacterium]|jgi:hypothetical protein
MRIISEELNKILKKEYKFRFFTLLFLYSSIVILVTIALISSSYLLLYLYEKAYVKQGLFVNNEILELDKINIQKTEDLYQLSRKIITEDKTEASIGATKILFEYASGLVSISSIEISQDSKITLRAVAHTRESLIVFNDKVKADATFNDFDIPIEALAKQKDINFSVTFTYHEN